MKIKKLICLLLMMCSMIFGTSAMAFSDGDVIEGVKLDTSSLSSTLKSYLEDCNYYVKLSNGKIYFGQYPFTAHLEFSRIYWSSSESTRLYVYSSGSSFYTFTSTYISTNPSSIVASNHDVYDENGSCFFPPPPEPTPKPATEVAEMVTQGATRVKTALIALIIVAFSAVSLIMFARYIRKRFPFFLRFLIK